MIVNPQFFNYRLIIGSLIMAIAVLSVFSYKNYQSIERERAFFEAEKKLVESELSQIISRYDALEINNSDLASQLEFAKINTEIALDSLSLLNSDLSVINKYRAQLNRLKSKNSALVANIDSLEDVNTDLVSEKQITTNALTLQQNKNAMLSKENSKLNSTIDVASELTATSFKALAYNSILGSKVETTKASKANAIDVCFTLAKNSLTTPGKKNIYIQIVSPNNNVLSDKGAIKFGNSTLIYSLKTTIDYNNKTLDICKSIKATKTEKPLLKGTYYVNVFHQGKKLGSTKVRLK
ncbi:hypothetical protein RM697_06270 [Ichthyenterobacterium sp. W332]|uniref:Chromosome partitioning protein ParA n=1 Tax=Microcosmobacter mediterraneus TaxID=3075607 RepID=A0ABU2YJB2_9FLAO|nr:hypothetical protein [Ichthyenterobacterium sp. W332]MDT0558241.1 hypothetical protein [Ichthyenterobacterium sp. W332]